MDKNIKFLVVHCTATPEGRDVMAEEIMRWHMAKPPAGRGWSRPGYSDLIKRDGTLVNLREYNQNDTVEHQEMTWGARGINAVSRHIVYAGGMSVDMKYAMDTRTDEQKSTLETYCRFMILRHPSIRIAGHNQFARKECPSFSVPEWLEEQGFSSTHIYRGSR